MYTIYTIYYRLGERAHGVIPAAPGSKGWAREEAKADIYIYIYIYTL